MNVEITKKEARRCVGREVTSEAKIEAVDR